MTTDQAQALALRALAYMAADERAIGGFMARSGIGPENLRMAAGEPEFLAAALDFMLEDESLLLAFCEAEGLPPEEPRRARMALPGANPEW